MNTTLLRTALAAMVLASILFALSCGDRNQNANNSNAAIATGNTSVVDPMAAAAPDPQCFNGTIAWRRTYVYDTIHADIANRYSKIQKQITDGYFKIDVYIAPDNKSLDIYLKGKIKGKKAWKDLSNILEPFMIGGCVEKVWLTKIGVQPPAAGTIDGDPGFLWSGCEEGTHPCPNGTCIPDGQTCPGGSLINGNTGNSNTGTPNTNANSRPPSNSNSGNKNG